ncbi:unnamed protein product [Ceutorhynchus assimilis]|uniref:Uncharacterized protein n=1 Tax=Ceutorhynchus assimilis TaxID=467358 RepID=A0A9N9MHT4_9CUCU|nr:unnamed protein product [Ceutorhynchus assimilis]
MHNILKLSNLEATPPEKIELPTEYNISESLEAYQIISTEENINLAEIEDIPIVFIADGPFSEEHEGKSFCYTYLSLEFHIYCAVFL